MVSNLFHKGRLLPLCIVLATMSGCTTPGSNLPVEQSMVVNAKDAEQLNILRLVNIYALTPELVATKKQLIPARNNPKLEKEMQSYQYRVSAADILNITVWDHPELTIPAGSYRSASEAGNWVRDDGTIFYPYIGSVYVKGKTTSEIRNILTKKLAKFIENPQIDVSVAAFRSQKIYVTGAVDKKGTQAITDVPLTLLDAINQADGLEKDADWRNVSLTRNGTTLHSSLFALMQKGDLEQNYLLKNGDIIHVPLNDGQKVFVMGEVNSPKTLVIDRAGMSLTEALSSVGGINELQADATGVFVVRTNSSRKHLNNKKQQQKVANVYQLDMKNAAAMALGTEFELQPFDIVYVTAAPIVRWNRVIAQFLPTISSVNLLSDSIYNLRRW